MVSAGLHTDLPLRPRMSARWVASPLFWGLILALGLAIRFRQYLFAHSFWYDESFLVLTIRDRGCADLIGPQPYNLVIPPLFLWATRGLYAAAGDGELMMRLPAFLAGVAALLLMVPLARRLVGGVQAVWAFVLLAISRSAVLHGCEVRPYMVDLLLTEVLLYGAVLLLDSTSSRTERRGAALLLCLIAALGPWLSFPCTFVLAGVSLALAVDFWKRSERRVWLVWVLFNSLVCFSGLMLWWFSARHMYYDGMIEHWGHQGWGGFPDWSKPSAILTWLVSRPFEIGKYGTKELGPLVVLLAFVGVWVLVKRSWALTVLVVSPSAVAAVAALLGKYPLADRTTFFLLPCLWLLAAMGIGAVVDWARARGWEVAWLGLVVVAVDFVWLGQRLVYPEPVIDYRGAYQFVESRHQPGDRIWAQTAVVYQTYYGKRAPVWTDDEFGEAERWVAHGRVWIVASEKREFPDALQAAGGRLILQRSFSKQTVWLFESR